MPPATPARPGQVADAIGLAQNRNLRFHMHHGLSAKYVDACPVPVFETAGYSPDDGLASRHIGQRKQAMARYELKTKVTDANVRDFIGAVENDTRRADADRLLEIYADATGMEPRMWGPSIIGYGSYVYATKSGCAGEMCRAGFSPRKANLVLYLMGGYCDLPTQKKQDALRARLGKHKTGASCLYINRLADVDMGVLKEMVTLDLAWMDERYPRGPV